MKHIRIEDDLYTLLVQKAREDDRSIHKTLQRMLYDVFSASTQRVLNTTAPATWPSRVKGETMFVPDPVVTPPEDIA